MTQKEANDSAIAEMKRGGTRAGSAAAIRRQAADEELAARDFQAKRATERRVLLASIAAEDEAEAARRYAGVLSANLQRRAKELAQVMG